ncbi:MAG: hypothetical protein C4523_19580 [Myxococcales bacterium]|nr:MAG: hypothetical protein C4523_19580 [Myxococcales bacterium]
MKPIHWLGLCALFLVSPLFVSFSMAEEQELGPLPWKEGEVVFSGWRVEAIERHEDHVRFAMSREGRRTVIEIAYPISSPGEFSTRDYRIQPAPKASPPRELIYGFKAFLDQWERAPGHKPFLQGIANVMTPPSPRSRLVQWLENMLSILQMQFWGFLYLASFFLALAHFAYLGVVWVRFDRRLLWPAIVTVGLAAGVVGYFWLFLTTDKISLSWINVLHEGNTGQNIKQLYANASHSGSVYHEAINILTSESVEALRQIVHLNMALVLINSLIFFPIALRVARTLWLALPISFFFVFNANNLASAQSGLPSQAITLLFLMGVVAGGTYNRPEMPRSARHAAILLFAIVSVLAALIRSELALIGVFALVVLLARASCGEARVLEWGRTMLAGLERLLRWPLWKLAVLISALLLFWLVFGLLNIHGILSAQKIEWLLDAFQPLNPSFFSLPYAMGFFLPFGIVVLFIFGVVHAFRRLDGFFMLPLSLLILYKVYFSASHGVFYEIFRYLTKITPMLLFLSLFGWKEIERFAERLQWRNAWRPFASALLAIMMFAFFPHEQYGYFNFFKPGIPSPVQPIVRNQQKEVHYLVHLVERFPECSFVSKVLRMHSDPRNQLVIFGAPHSDIKRIPYNGEDFISTIAGNLPEEYHGCVFFYHGLDCNRVEQMSCVPETEGLQPVDHYVFRSKPYSDENEYGRLSPNIRLVLYKIDFEGKMRSGQRSESDPRIAPAPVVSPPRQSDEAGDSFDFLEGREDPDRPFLDDPKTRR